MAAELGAELGAVMRTACRHRPLTCSISTKVSAVLLSRLCAVLVTRRPSSNRQLRSLDKSIAFSLPPISGSSPDGQHQKPFKKGLVLIGGFGDMPDMWEGLAERASTEGWYTLAPRTPGWGRTDFDEANKVSWTE